MANNNRAVLQEYISPSLSKMKAGADMTIGENGEKKKNWYLDGIFIQGEVENLNGRIYPRNEIARAVESLNETIQNTGAVLGELDHPDTLVINTHNVSHIIQSISMSDNDGVGRMKIIGEVPSGKIVEGLLSSGVPLGVSSRGSGNVDDYTRLVSDFEIVTVDIVATPSAQNARPTPIYEQMLGYKGQQLYKNAQDCIASNHRHTDAFNGDVISWIKSWSVRK